MITNYIPNTCKYSVNNLKKVVHIFSESENVIHIDNGEAYVTSGITDFQTIYATSVDFAESTSYDDRFKFEKQITVTVDGFLKLDSLNNKFYVVLEDENHTMWLVNADFPSFVTYTYTLADGTDETVFTFNVLSNFPTLKLNAKINNSYECKDYSLANVKELKMNLKENCTIDHVNHIIYDSSNTPYYIVKFNEGTLKMEETYDGFNVTTTIEFNINFDDYKSSWHYNLLEYQDNKYVAVTDHLACGFEMGLIPSYNVQGSSQKGQGDIVTIRLVGTSQRGSEWAEKWTEATLIPDYVWLLTEEWTCYTPPTPPPPPFDGKYKLTLNDSSVISAECDATSAITSLHVGGYRDSATTLEVGDCVTGLTLYAYSSTNIKAPFTNFTALTSAYISDSVTVIARDTFAGCYNLVSVNIPNRLTEIVTRTFAYCRSLANIVIPDSVVQIGENAFRDCSGATSLSIGSGLTAFTYGIGSNYDSFYGCNSFTSITVDSNNTVFDSRNNCNSLIESSTNTLMFGSSNSTIPNTVTSILSGAFSYRFGLTSIDIPDSVTSIGQQAFYYCSGLTSCTIGSGVTSIGANTFDGCRSLKSVTIPNSVTSIGQYAFQTCSSLTSITIPSSVTSIGKSAFYNCSGLTSIEMPANVTSIGASAFWGCRSLTDVIIGSGITSVGANAFRGCYNITGITIYATTPPSIDSMSLVTGSENEPPIYVPAESVNAYKTTSVWRDYYVDRIQAIP